MNVAKELNQILKDWNINVFPAIEKIQTLTEDLKQIHWGKDASLDLVAQKIKDYEYSNIKFVFLPLPFSGVTKAELYREGHTVIRYLESHQLMSDDIISRYDILILKV